MKQRLVFAIFFAEVCSEILKSDVVDRLQKLQKEKNISSEEMTVLFDKIESERTKDFPMVCSFSYRVKEYNFNFEKIPKN